MRRFLKTTGAEIVLARSWWKTTTRDKLSECRHEQSQRLRSPRPGAGEEMDVGESMVDLPQPVNQFPQFERVDHRAQEPSWSGFRSQETNTDDRVRCVSESQRASTGIVSIELVWWNPLAHATTVPGNWAVQSRAQSEQMARVRGVHGKRT